MRTGKQCAAEIFGGWRGCLCCLCWGCCCCGDGTTNGARSRRFFHLRLHDLDMEGSVMCRLRAAVCGGVGVTTGRDIQPSLRPQREVHAVSDKHKPVGGNPGMDLWCPRCVKKMTPTCVSLSLPGPVHGEFRCTPNSPNTGTNCGREALQASSHNKVNKTFNRAASINSRRSECPRLR